MVYDNLFYNKALRDVLKASTRSVGCAGRIPAGARINPELARTQQSPPVRLGQYAARQQGAGGESPLAEGH